MSNDTQVLRTTLETALARIEDMLADDDGQAFKEARKFLESARQLAEQPGFVMVPLDVLERAAESLGSFVSDHGWSDQDMQNMDNLDAFIARHKANLAARPLTASPTAPSTEASEPVGEREQFEADPELTPAAFAERLARHMKVASLTAKEVSELTGVSETTLSRLKNHGRMPDAISYAALCNFMGWHPHIKHRLAARTTPPPAPVLSDAEIEQAVKAARHPSGTLTPTDLARAIEQAIGRASRGAK